VLGPVAENAGPFFVEMGRLLSGVQGRPLSSDDVTAISARRRKYYGPIKVVLLDDDDGPTVASGSPTTASHIEPTAPTKGSGAASPTEPTKGSGAASPTKPTKGSGAAASPTEPTAPTKGSGAASPTEPTKGSGAASPTEPTKGSGAASSTEPTGFDVASPDAYAASSTEQQEGAAKVEQYGSITVAWCSLNEHLWAGKIYMGYKLGAFSQIDTKHKRIVLCKKGDQESWSVFEKGKHGQRSSRKDGGKVLVYTNRGPPPLPPTPSRTVIADLQARFGASLIGQQNAAMRLLPVSLSRATRTNTKIALLGANHEKPAPAQDPVLATPKRKVGSTTSDRLLGKRARLSLLESDGDSVTEVEGRDDDEETETEDGEPHAECIKKESKLVSGLAETTKKLKEARAKLVAQTAQLRSQQAEVEAGVKAAAAAEGKAAKALAAAEGKATRAIATAEAKIGKALAAAEAGRAQAETKASQAEAAAASAASRLVAAEASTASRLAAAEAAASEAKSAAKSATILAAAADTRASSMEAALAAERQTTARLVEALVLRHAAPTPPPPPPAPTSLDGYIKISDWLLMQNSTRQL